MTRSISKRTAETKAIAARLARKIFFSAGGGSASGGKKPSENAVVIVLKGDLGAGKTTFARGFIGACITRKKVQSPTFVLMKRFPISKKHSGVFRNIFHIDAYRLKNEKEATSLRLYELFSDPTALILIEWPERIFSIIPKKHTRVLFSHKTPRERIINIHEAHA
ncbi:MAG: tRNA (adenosine(37)-N6)-threonylcarbamoyltransferase complex ATPase subunit type 1 TsaE [Patescibacteria group bacterium]